MINSLLREAKVTRVSASAAAAQTDVTSSAVDTKGFEGCLFIVAMGAITGSAVTSAHVEQCDTSGGSYTELDDTEITIADDDDGKLVLIDVKNTSERYLKCVVDRGTEDAVVDGIIAIQYGAAAVPTTHDATTVIDSAFALTPDEAV